MPLIILGWGLGSLALGAGIKLAGDGVEDTATGFSKLILAGGVAYGAYVIARHQGVIK